MNFDRIKLVEISQEKSQLSILTIVEKIDIAHITPEYAKSDCIDYNLIFPNIFRTIFSLMTREEKNKFQNCGEFSWKALEKHAEDMSNPLIFLPITYYSHDPKLFRLKEQALKSNSKFKICDFTNFENIILLIDAEKIKEIRYATFPISSSKNRPLKAKFNRDDQNKTTGNLEAEFYFEIEFMDNCGSLFDLPKDTPIDLDDLTDLT